jgi:hypothetical protein
MEHIKRNLDDDHAVYHFRRQNVSKKYNNQHDLHYAQGSIKLLSSGEREKMKKQHSLSRAGSAADKEQCRKLVEELRPTRKKLLTREATCKEGLGKEKVHVRPQLKCPKNNCGAKPYVYPSAFVKHLRFTHGCTAEEAVSESSRQMQTTVFYQVYAAPIMTPQSLLTEIADDAEEEENVVQPGTIITRLYMLDTETTSLQGAAVELGAYDVTDTRTFCSFIAPPAGETMTEGATKVSGIKRGRRRGSNICCPQHEQVR